MSVISCPEIADLERFLSHELDDASNTAVADHLSGCSQCTAIVEELTENARLESSLRLKASFHSSAEIHVQASDPETVGPYQILRKLGQGGMGTVYEAQQENPRRVVALKMIRPGLVSTRLLARFRHEAQVLGRLRHAGIAQIYEAGTHAGQPYFVMELVHGTPLVQLADSKRLDTNSRLELIAKVCDAVQHAHQRGVIHRDLKPDNILVDDSGESPQPKILDFGVARIVDPESQTTTLHTSAGQIVGTIAYMSPEQANANPLDIDTRADVYALGVICYQLLSGKLPYRLNITSVAESVRAIVQDEPTPLSTVDRALRGDITTIVGKALEKDKSRRYPSAAEMAADIRRYLRDEPIAAHPPSTIYQARKFARRNKGLVAGIAMAFLLLVLGIIGVFVQWRRAERARDAADLSAKSAQREAEKQAAVNGFLKEMLGAANPRNLTADDRAKGLNVSVLQALKVAAERVNSGLLKDQPDVEFAVHASIGESFSEIGELDLADKHFQAALELSKRMYGPENGNAADMLNSLALLRKSQGRLPEALAYAQQSLDMARKAYGEKHDLVASATDTLAAMLQAQGQLTESEKLFRKALALRRELFGPEDKRVGTGLNNLGFVLDDLGRRDEAELLYRECLRIRRKVLGDHPDTASCMNNLAFILRSRGELAEAENMFRESLAMRQRTLGEEHPLVAVGLNNLGSILQQQRKFDEADALYRRALAMLKKFHGETHPAIANVLNNLGSVMLEQKKFDEAETWFRQSLEMRQKLLPENHPSIARVLGNLAEVLREQKRIAEAEPMMRRALEMALSRLGKDHEDVAQYRQALGGCLIDLKRYEEAESELIEADRVLRPRLAMGEKHAVATARNLARLYDETGKPDKAREWRNRIPAAATTMTSAAPTTQK